MESDNLTDTKKYEMLSTVYKEVQKAKIEWEQSVDCINDIFILTDLDGNILRCNKKLIKLTGEPFNKILGQNWKNIFKQYGFTKETHGEKHIDIIHSSGERFHIDSCSVKNTKDIVFGKVLYLHNVTTLRRLREEVEDKNIELNKAYNKLKEAQSQILQQEKMASIGQLAAGIAHEINNPIGFIMSNLSSLNKYSSKIVEFLNEQSNVIESVSNHAKDALKLKFSNLKDKKRELKIDFILEDIVNLVKESVEGAYRVKKIVQDLKSFSHIDEEEYKLSNINDGLDTTINIVWNELKYKVTLKKEYSDIPLTKCNPGQLNQVFMNLLINASHAINEKGEIVIKTWDKENYIFISIYDTGCGIPEKNLNRLFEPFFTTKDVGMGTGLGLSIAFDIIKKHKGEINVNSVVGKGTKFTIKIPVVN